MDNLREIQKNYIFAKQVLEAISDADRKDELAHLGRMLSLEEIYKIQFMVKAWEDQGIKYTFHRIDQDERRYFN